MNCAFSTRFVDEHGNWLDLANRKNISSDIAPTAGQMPRGLGLAFASRCFRASKHQDQLEHLSHNGNEICFTTIGDASTSEGHFWETINAAGVLQVPLAVFVWDDGYGISVPKNFQTTKGSISAALKGFQKQADTNGIHIYKVKAWDYAGMCEVFEEALQKVRETHEPALFHVEEVTQPQGHSTSGSHERYKTPERLEWEKEWDCIKKMKEWMLENGLASSEELAAVEAEAKETVREGRNLAWEKYVAPIKDQAARASELIRQSMVNDIDKYNQLQQMANELANNKEPLRRDVIRTIALAIEVAPSSPSATELKELRSVLLDESKQLYNSHLYNEGPKSALKVPEIKPLDSF